MSGKKRGPYRQYLREDEPFQSPALQKKLRRSNKECKHTPDLLATEFADEHDHEEIDLHQNEFASSVEERGCQEEENIDTSLDEFSKDPCGSNWIGEENFEHVDSRGDIDYLSDSDLFSCSSTAGTLYDFDSDNSTDGSDYEDCDVEQAHDNDPPIFYPAYC